MSSTGFCSTAGARWCFADRRGRGGPCRRRPALRRLREPLAARYRHAARPPCTDVDPASRRRRCRGCARGPADLADAGRCRLLRRHRGRRRAAQRDGRLQHLRAGRGLARSAGAVCLERGAGAGGGLSGRYGLRTQRHGDADRSHDAQAGRASLRSGRRNRVRLHAGRQARGGVCRRRCRSHRRLAAVPLRPRRPGAGDAGAGAASRSGTRGRRPGGVLCRRRRQLVALPSRRPRLRGLHRRRPLGENGATREQSGIVVEREGEAIADLRCTGPVRSLLGPEWFERVGVSADEDAEFEIPAD